jgi:hypothetical protein
VLAGRPAGTDDLGRRRVGDEREERMIGPFPANFFADPTTGLATITHGFTTSVTSGVFKLTQP